MTSSCHGQGQGNRGRPHFTVNSTVVGDLTTQWARTLVDNIITWFSWNTYSGFSIWMDKNGHTIWTTLHENALRIASPFWGESTSYQWIHHTKTNIRIVGHLRYHNAHMTPLEYCQVFDSRVPISLTSHFLLCLTATFGQNLSNQFEW